MSLKRKILRAAKENLMTSTIDAHKFSADDIEVFKRTIVELAGSADSDPRTRHMSAKTGLDHSLAVYAHEHPAIQRSEINMSIGFPGKIEIVDINNTTQED